MSGIRLTKDEILEVFIRAHMDDITISQSVGKILGREEYEDYQEFNLACQLMRDGWVRMNESIRQLGKNK